MEDQQSRFVLAVQQGQTKFPVRPLLGDRLLIGAGSQCQLQLGGDMPLVHSLLTCGPRGWEIEALSNWPLLMVNHQSVRRVLLQPGDVLQLGDFVFCYRLAQRGELPVLQGDMVQQANDSVASESLPMVDAVASDPQLLSATELAEQLAEALNELKQLESRQRRGWERLLTAVATAHEELETPAERSRQISAPESTPSKVSQQQGLLLAIDDLQKREAQLQQKLDQLDRQRQQVREELDSLQTTLQQLRQGLETPWRRSA